jgi:succinate-semialdehyde dehydrogenase/glutarate-semialdehyde dehydrogenase
MHDLPADTSQFAAGKALGLSDPSLLREACHVGGQWITAADGATIAVRNPATGEIVGHAPSLSRAEIALAIEAAHRAQPLWRARTAKERGVLLRRLYDLMVANADDLAKILTAEQGKPLAEAKGEILYAAAFLDWFAEEGKRVYGDVIPPPMRGRRLLVTKEPVGVFAAITPWNFPTGMITRKAGPGWAAGCAGVIRPADETPFSALALAVLAERAGFPAGVCNVVTGEAVESGKELCENPLVRKLSFTGSTRVGALLMAQCAPTIKRTSMELGGNAAFIVFDDADLDAAVKGAMASKYRNAGQTCVCANRFLVQAGVFDAFAEKFTLAVQALKVGPGDQAGVTQGPLINAAAMQKVGAYVDDARARGAKALTGGAPHALGGNFFEPTVLTDVPTDARLFAEEIFGPVAPLYRFETEAQAIALANDTPFGLAAYFYSRDIGRVFRVAEALEVGLVGVNEGIISSEVSPFGGVKASGVGREGGRYGIEEYLEVKAITLGGIDG